MNNGVENASKLARVPWAQPF